MAILRVYEVSEQRSASESTQQEGEGSLWTSANVDRYFYVETDGNEVTQVEVRNAVDPTTSETIPSIGEPHPNNPFLFALDFQIREMGRCHWIVTVGYVSAGSALNPTDELPTAQWRSVRREEAIDQDRFNKPITNAADESYDPPVKKRFSDWEFVYSCNVLAFNTAAWSGYLDRINSDTFRGFPPNTCIVDSVEGQYRIRGAFSYFRVTVKIHARNYYRKGQAGTLKQLGWIKLVENKGFRKKVSGKYIGLTDDNGHPTRTPFYLKADGSDKITDPTQANWREHEVQDVVAFSGMNALAPGIYTA